MSVGINRIGRSKFAGCCHQRCHVAIFGDFLASWGKRPVTEITALGVRSVVKAAKDRGAPYQAHNLLVLARRLFSWAIDQHGRLAGTRIGGSMWNERKMPERWYGLLRQRMQVEEQRMRVIKDGDIIEGDDLERLMAEADRLDREMLLVMRQAIAAALVREAA
jgi:hypothetical protein